MEFRSSRCFTSHTETTLFLTFYRKKKPKPQNVLLTSPLRCRSSFLFFLFSFFFLSLCWNSPAPPDLSLGMNLVFGSLHRFPEIKSDLRASWSVKLSLALRRQRFSTLKVCFGDGDQSGCQLLGFFLYISPVLFFPLRFLRPHSIPALGDTGLASRFFNVSSSFAWESKLLLSSFKHFPAASPQLVSFWTEGLFHTAVWIPASDPKTQEFLNCGTNKV